MKRVLVNISNSDLNKKIISFSAKLQGFNFFFLSGIEDFIGEFKIIQPDVLIVGDKEYKSLATNTACHSLINSISKFIVAGHDSKETLITAGLNPIVLQQDFDIEDIKQLMTSVHEINISDLHEKQLEVELRDEKWYTQVLMDNIPDAIYYKDSSSKFTRVNQAHADLMGLQSPDQAIGKTDFDFFPEEQARICFQDEFDIMKSGEPLINLIEKVNRADGSIIWVSTTKIPIKDDNGTIVGLVGVSRDVTGFKMKLQQEKNLLNELLNNIPDLIYFKDLESRFIRVNKAHARTIGIQNPKDAVGKTDADFFDETHSKDAYNDEQKMMRTGVPILNKLEHIKTKDGYRYVTATKIPLKDDRGAIIGMVGVTRDVTKSHSLEMNLQQETNLLNALLDSVPDSVFFKDTKSKFIRVSKSWLRKHNISDGEKIIGKSDADFLGAEFASETYREEQIMMETGKPLIDKLQSKIDANGKQRYDIANKVPIFDRNNKVVGMFGISRDITELKNAELKLYKERELLQSLLDNTPDTIYFKDTLSKFTKINLAQAKCLGIQSPDEAIGKSDFDYAPKEQASLSFQDEVDIIKSGKPLINRVEKVQRADGNITWVSTTKIPIKDQFGKISGIVGVSRDVTESHNLEMKLQQETKLLNTLLDNIPDTIYFKDSLSRFTRVNQAQAKSLGVQSPDEAIGKTDFDFFDNYHATIAFNDEQEMMRIGKPIINKLEHFKTNSEYRYVTATKIPLKDDQGMLLGMVGISHEITDLKNTEFALNKEKELLQALMDNIPDTIYFKDSLSRFTRVNQAQAKSLGVQSPDEAIGKTDFDFSPKEQASLSFQDELDIMESGKPLINRVEKVHRSDGSIIWVSTTKIPVRDQLGKISGTVGMSRDITVLEEARNNLVYAKEKADEANKAKSLFLANMSHEIRTPMNGVIGMSDVLNQTILTDEQREYLTIIIKSGNSLLSIINNILDFSKIESGSLELEKAPINIRQIIENVADVLITTASNKGVDLMNYVDSSIPEIVEGDSVRLSQVLINLVNNALKFTEHGEVYFTAELTESTEITFKVLFKVKDNGIGISKDAQQKIFHSFTQVDSSTTRKYGGTGLGLAISKRLVEMMGGTIGVESVEGEGSLFWFTAKFGVCSEKKPIKLTTKLLIDGLKVLIVDDNRTNRFVFGKYLEIWNCKYDLAENGEIALKMLVENAERNSPFDVALIDYQMERMDGLKLAEQIQKNPLISSTRLILLSSVTDVIPRSEVARRGFNYFLNKPVKLKELYDVISSVTGNNQGDKLKQTINADDFQPNLSVLVVEDNPTNLKVAQLILKPFITAFDSAENGLIAFEKFKTNKYDVIFMDIQMPVMNGYEATKSIRDYEIENNLTPVKIVAMTANAMKEDVEQCLSSGMDEYLSKPFRRDDMFRIIERLNLLQ